MSVHRVVNDDTLIIKPKYADGVELSGKSWHVAVDGSLSIRDELLSDMESDWDNEGEEGSVTSPKSPRSPRARKKSFASPRRASSSGSLIDMKDINSPPTGAVQDSESSAKENGQGETSINTPETNPEEMESEAWQTKLPSDISNEKKDNIKQLVAEVPKADQAGAGGQYANVDALQSLVRPVMPSVDVGNAQSFIRPVMKVDTRDNKDNVKVGTDDQSSLNANNHSNVETKDETSEVESKDKLELPVGEACNIQPVCNIQPLEENEKDKEASGSTASQRTGVSVLEPLPVVTAQRGDSQTKHVLRPPVVVDDNQPLFQCAHAHCKGWKSDSQVSFKLHCMSRHYRQVPQFCYACTAMFKDEDLLIAHIMTTHGREPTLPYRCAAHSCRFSTNIMHDFKTHLLLRHKADKSFACVYCKDSYKSQDSLVDHIITNVLKLHRCPACHISTPQIARY